MSPTAPENLTRVKARTCMLINQFATPGLGSLIGGRTVSGAGQLLLALAGFGLLMSWMGWHFYRRMLELSDRPMPPLAHNAWGKWGLILFGSAWLWSWITSVSLLREARTASTPDKTI